MNPVFVVELFGLRIPDTVFVTLAVTGLTALLLYLASRRLETHGLARWQVALESFVEWIHDTLEDIFGEDPTPYAPLIAALVAFIGISNLLAIVPVVRAPTADLSTTVALALVVFFAVPFFGIRRHGFRGYFRKYFEPHPLVMPFNLIGELSRTLALAIRLFGNVMSGNMIGGIVLLIAGAILPIPLMMLGVLTGLVQAYIFGILAAVYIAAAVEAGVRSPEPQEEQAHG